MSTKMKLQKFQKKKKNGEFWVHDEGNECTHVESYKRSLTEKIGFDETQRKCKTCGGCFQ